MNILNEREFDIQTMPNSEMSQIFLNGEKTNSVIYGRVLELCVKKDDQFLVFLTDDIPNEDRLHIHLLNHKLEVVDAASIGSIYSTGSFKGPVIESQNRITFNFIGGNKWTLTLLQSKKFRLPLLSSVKGVSRKHLFHQYFKLYSAPKPEI